MMKNRALLFLGCVLLLVVLACNVPFITTMSPDENDENDVDLVTASQDQASSDQPTLPPPDPQTLVQPVDLVYEGAFRLPERVPDAPDAESWEYGGQALTYRPDGDPGGTADGYPGSLFGTGHDVYNYVSEIAIPVPSPSRNIEELPVAETLQGFHDVRGGLFTGLEEMLRVGLQYLPAHEGDDTARLHMAWGQHHHDEGSPSDTPSHAYSSVELSQPETKGAWWIGDARLYSVNGYMFEIPGEWAGVHTAGARLATGRYRDGGWSGKGPSMIAYGPWLDGNPPAAGSRLAAYPLLLYSYWDDEHDVRLNGYNDSDQWEGGAWITAGEKSAVLFTGTKGGGDYWWYGYTSPGGDGMPCLAEGAPDETYCFNADGSSCASNVSGHCSGYIEESKGWWSSRFDAQIIFYNPADFSRTAAGEIQPNLPQPYAVLDMDEHLFLNAGESLAMMIGSGDQRNYRIGEAAYDRERNLLYIIELFAAEAAPVVHVWRIN